MLNVIGLGYIGLPTTLMFASKGIHVVGTDYNGELIEILQSGKTTFDEKGLDDLFRKAQENGVQFSSDYQRTNMYIVAVPTPFMKDTKKIDASYVVMAVNSILDTCEKGAIIIIESTISPGTIDRFVRPILQTRGLVIGDDIHLAHAPERIIPGNMVYELENNARILGVDDIRVGEQIKTLYKSFCKGEIIITDIRSAEMTKIVENTYRDINIAFANELAKICRLDNLDVYEIIRIANMHPRVNILQPGPGVGGHCISVDPWFLVGDYPGLANIILAARKINDSMPEFVLDRIFSIMKENHMTDLSRIGFYGLTYKEDVDDVRESPTLQLIESMRRHMAPLPKTYDPFITKDLFENQYHDFDDFIKDIDIVVIMVGHEEMKRNLDKIKDKIILDTKNICTFEKTYKI